MFDSDVGEAIKLASYNHLILDGDAMQLISAARILRRDIFNKVYTFNGSMDVGCEIDAVPENGLSFIKMILYSLNILNQKQLTEISSKTAVSFTELVCFNANKRYRMKAKQTKLDMIKQERPRWSFIPV